MKLKRLLPITALVAASPLVTLITSCNHDDGIEIEPEDGNTPNYLKPSHEINLKKNQLYELSIELEDVDPSIQQEIKQIDAWSIFVSNNGKDPITTPFEITYIKVWFNEKLQTKGDWFETEGNKVKGLKAIQSSWGIWHSEIEVDIKISENIEASNFVFQYSGS